MKNWFKFLFPEKKKPESAEEINRKILALLRNLNGDIMSIIDKQLILSGRSEGHEWVCNSCGLPVRECIVVNPQSQPGE